MCSSGGGKGPADDEVGKAGKGARVATVEWDVAARSTTLSSVETMGFEPIKVWREPGNRRPTTTNAHFRQRPCSRAIDNAQICGDDGI